MLDQCVSLLAPGEAVGLFSPLGDQQIYFIICIFNGWLPGFQDRNFLDYKISNNLGNLHKLQQHKAIVNDYMC